MSNLGVAQLLKWSPEGLNSYAKSLTDLASKVVDLQDDIEIIESTAFFGAAGRSSQIYADGVRTKIKTYAHDVQQSAAALSAAARSIDHIQRDLKAAQAAVAGNQSGFKITNSGMLVSPTKPAVDATNHASVVAGLNYDVEATTAKSSSLVIQNALYEAEGVDATLYSALVKCFDVPTEAKTSAMFANLDWAQLSAIDPDLLTRAPDANEFFGVTANTITNFGAGVVDGSIGMATGIGQLLVFTSPIHGLFEAVDFFKDPQAYTAKRQALVTAITSNPRKFFDQIVKADEAEKNPMRWLGEFALNVATTVGTGGVGLGAKASVTAERAAQASSEAKLIGVAAQKARAIAAIAKKGAAARAAGLLQAQKFARASAITLKFKRAEIPLRPEGSGIFARSHLLGDLDAKEMIHLDALGPAGNELRDAIVDINSRRPIWDRNITPIDIAVDLKSPIDHSTAAYVRANGRMPDPYATPSGLLYHAEYFGLTEIKKLQKNAPNKYLFGTSPIKSTTIHEWWHRLENELAISDKRLGTSYVDELQAIFDAHTAPLSADLSFSQKMQKLGVSEYGSKDKHEAFAEMGSAIDGGSWDKTNLFFVDIKNFVDRVSSPSSPERLERQALLIDDVPDYFVANDFGKHYTAYESYTNATRIDAWRQVLNGANRNAVGERAIIEESERVDKAATAPKGLAFAQRLTVARNQRIFAENYARMSSESVSDLSKQAETSIGLMNPPQLSEESRAVLQDFKKGADEGVWTLDDVLADVVSKTGWDGEVVDGGVVSNQQLAYEAATKARGASDIKSSPLYTYDVNFPAATFWEDVSSTLTKLEAKGYNVDMNSLTVVNGQAKILMTTPQSKLTELSFTTPQNYSAAKLMDNFQQHLAVQEPSVSEPFRRAVFATLRDKVKLPEIPKVGQ